MEHRRVACLYADVSGYSRLIADNVDQTVQMLADCQAVFAQQVVSHGGVVADVAGDSLLAVFSTVEAAVRCAIDVQRQLRVRNAALPPHRRLQLRIGIDTGEVLVERGRLYGNCVNLATRVQELASPGRICLAGSALDHLEGLSSLRVEDLGERTVKHFDRPLRIYQIDDG
jgi:class 3 adenylate cyclase